MSGVSEYLPVAQNYSGAAFHFHVSESFSATESINVYGRSYYLQVSVIEFLKDKSSDLCVCHSEDQNCFLFLIRKIVWHLNSHGSVGSQESFLTV